MMVSVFYHVNLLYSHWHLLW